MCCYQKHLFTARETFGRFFYVLQLNFQSMIDHWNEQIVVTFLCCNLSITYTWVCNECVCVCVWGGCVCVCVCVWHRQIPCMLKIFFLAWIWSIIHSIQLYFLLKLRVKAVVPKIKHQLLLWRVNIHLGKQPLGYAVRGTSLIKLRIRSITSCFRFRQNQSLSTGLINCTNIIKLFTGKTCPRVLHDFIRR